jgi:hypothetical protein
VWWGKDGGVHAPALIAIFLIFFCCVGGHSVEVEERLKRTEGKGYV